MTSALDKILARTGKTREDLVTSRGATGRLWRQKGVEDGKDISRAIDLPSRDWREMEDLPGLCDQMTEWLRSPGGTWKLRPIQAVALLELYDYGGMFGPIRVGGGKTLISLLAPRVVGAKRPMLIVPASLRDKTNKELGEYRRNWTIKPMIIESYEKLGRENQARFLEETRPDLIVFDEVHKVRNKDAAVTRRVMRYMSNHPDTMVAAMSGTPTTRSLHDYAHILQWTHGKNTPLPSIYNRLQQWAFALDEKVPAGSRMAPGALLRFTDPREDTQDIRGARRGFQRRLTTLPGVVATQDAPLPFGLTIREIPLEPSPEMIENFQTLRDMWETPDGHPCSDGHEIWRHARELACGFFYVWDPRPPKTTYEVWKSRGGYKMTWLESRREWCAFVRHVLKHNRSNLDAESQVKTAINNGTLGNYPGLESPHGGETLLRTWEDIRPTFEPVTRPVWYCDHMINLAADWLQGGEGICWVEHTAFGRRLSEVSGLPYYGRQGKDAKGNAIEDAKGPIIAGIASNSTGRNLQRYNRNLITSLPGNGAAWEQLIGRTHRDGQKAPEVSFDVVIPCLEQWAGFKQARADADYITDTTGQIQKLCYAEIQVAEEHIINSRSGPLWNK